MLKTLSEHILLQVERERNLLNSNLMKFDNLLRNPYTGPCNSALSSQSPFPAASPNAFSPTPQDSAAPSLSSFNQVGSLVNMGFGTRRELLLPFELLLSCLCKSICFLLPIFLLRIVEVSYFDTMFPA